jgi:hypothetical protein
MSFLGLKGEPLFRIDHRHALATVVAAGVLAAAGSANAGTRESGLITYNGHAGLGASVYQHNQTDHDFSAVSPRAPVAGVQDGTSNTIMF